MDNSLITQLAESPVCGYLAQDTGATEPTALVALALAAHGQRDAARQAADWLAVTQATDGSVSVRRNTDGPRWPTSLSVLAWHVVDRVAFAERIDRAVTWMLSIRGKTQARSSEIHHDSTLAAWPWVVGTHAWIEPTALHVLALKATGYGDHPRVREAVRMLVDRQIPGGGCNYGNTGVLGQTLWPHVQPTGLALWALGGENLGAGRIKASVAWLQQALCQRTTCMSLAWGLLGLRAQDAHLGDTIPSGAADWIEQAHARNAAGQCSAYKTALLLLAAGAVAGRDCLIAPKFRDRSTSWGPGKTGGETVQ